MKDRGGRGGKPLIIFEDSPLCRWRNEDGKGGKDWNQLMADSVVGFSFCFSRSELGPLHCEGKVAAYNVQLPTLSCH